MALDPSAWEAMATLCIGLALSGLLASAYELFTEQRASFSLLERGGVAAVAALPVLAFSAPFIILRNTVRGRRIEGRPIPFVMLATMIACGWSLISGRIALDLAALLVGA
ncbi:DUF6949 family protein [Methylobacterium oxalidis]|jgi:hypothetical protein|uniref:Uncharacterized protein n=1 Tax=Methylobacterium oxalidis TaxID=944322 RepID=A0A512JC93_9HYPH|nr:hypothetical protein [Methylobacterium oxalidis]GEP07541.1 hypothetical protein MOX02_55790 [Methylobacterium oxalidis]GLS63948.1 hypothetical protein GCM10007888_23290 [Methylobacterium oxalidis]